MNETSVMTLSGPQARKMIKKISNKKTNACYSLIRFVLLILFFSLATTAISDAATDEYDQNQDTPGSVASVQISNVTIEPEVLLPWDLATVTLVLVNTDKKTQISVTKAGIVSKEVKVHTLQYEKVGTIGPNNHLPLTFTVQAGMKPGIYYPVFFASFLGSQSIRFPFPIKVQTNPVHLSVYGTPDTFMKGKKGTIFINIANLGTHPINGVMVTPSKGPHTIIPFSHFVGELSPDSPIKILFNVTPSQSENLTFTATFQNGLNQHSTDCSLPIMLGESIRQANLSISRLEVEPGPGHIVVKGDLYNSGLETANGVTVSIKNPAEAVNPNKISAVGILKPSEFASFQVTFKPSPGSHAETLTFKFKDTDGSVVTGDVPFDISDVLSRINASSIVTANETTLLFGFIPAGFELPVACFIVILLSATILNIRRRKKARLQTRTLKPGDKEDVKTDLREQNKELYNQALSLFRLKDYTRAAELMFEIVEKDNSDHRAWNSYGICLSKLREYNSAAVCFNNATNLDPDNPVYQKNKGVNEKKMGKGNV